MSCTKTVHDGRAGVEDPDRLDMLGALTYVTVRGDGGWRIALAQTTPMVPAPTMTPELQAARNPARSRTMNGCRSPGVDDGTEVRA